MKILSLSGILFCLLLAGCSSIMLEQNYQNITSSNIESIISGSATIKGHSDLLKQSILKNNKGSIGISTGERNGMFRATVQEFQNKKIIVESMTGTFALSLMTYNPKLLNSLEPSYKGPFTNNIINVGEKIEYSKNSLSGYLDANDEYIFILVTNISQENSILEYTTTDY